MREEKYIQPKERRRRVVCGFLPQHTSAHQKEKPAALCRASRHIYGFADAVTCVPVRYCGSQYDIIRKGTVEVRVRGELFVGP